MPYLKLYIHFVWTTKNREPFLNSKALRSRVWRYISEYAQEKSIFIDQISGYHDHCHCLVSMSGTQTASNIMKLLKGASSYWINKNELEEGHFGWQDAYYAASVSEDALPRVRKYIRDQEEKHKRITFPQECDELENDFGFVEITE